MFKVAIVIFRESLEISLLLGILLALTKTIQNSRISIALGALIGLALAAVFAFFTKTLSSMLIDVEDDIFDSAIILLTALIISWTVVWMQGYTKKIKKNVNDLSGEISKGKEGRLMLIPIVATTLFREGSEILLFIYSISSTESMKISDYLIGIALGSFLGFLVGGIIYKGLIKFSGKYLFKISSILLILIAAGLASGAATILTSSGVVETMSEQLWDTSWFIENESFVGKILHIIAGYDAKPNGLQLTFYLGTILLNISMISLRTIMMQSKND
jgi:high-affinity iron transporter